MSENSMDREQIRQLAANLAQTAEKVESDDLSLLAKMHGCGETLAQQAQAGEEPELAAAAQSLVKLLEAIILAETDSPEAALAQVQVTAQMIVGLTGGEVAPAGDPAEPAAEPAAHEPAAPVEAAMPAPQASPEPQPAPEVPASDTPEPAAPPAQPEPIAAAPEPTPEPVAAAPAPAPEPTAVVEADAEADDKPAELAQYEPQPLTIDPKEQEFVAAFADEAREHIEAIEAAVLEVERAPNNAEHIDSLFRPFHTIKGMAGFLNLRDVNCLTHEVETLLDQGRKGKRDVTPGLIDLIFEVVDILKAQVSAIAAHLADPQGEIVPQPPVAEMIGHLRAVVARQIEPQSIEAGPGSGAQRVGENLVEQKAVAKEVVEFAVAQQQAGGGSKKTGELLVEMGTATPKQISQAIRPQAEAQRAAGGAAPAAAAAPTEASIRIDTAKLDALVDMVGELVIAQTQVNADARVTTDPILNKNVGQVTKIVRDVQETAMAMRMVPIGGTFQRMARLVRDVSRKAGKRVELVISGEETELDKNVIQQINDPLVHMVRNAVDHGIEPPEARKAAGKDETGRVYLSAYHHAGNIVIDIRDDGRGLDPEVLRAKAVEKGVIAPDEELTEQQAYHLIFAAGFSTAAQVTDISGRGVGMDVVKRNLEQLRGKIEITSAKGGGSTFSIRLPLTLAIIDGMVVQLGSERFIFPTISIEQALRPQPEQITTVQQRGEVLNVRGQLIPLVQLGALFGLTRQVNPCEAMVVIASSDEGPVGVIVDELLGQQQVVIKTLGERFEGVRGISGAAILGDGRVGLILEMSGLAAAHRAVCLGEIEWQRLPEVSNDSETKPAQPRGASDDEPADTETEPTCDNATEATPTAEPVLV